MLVVRPAKSDDIDPLFELIQRSEYGLTTLKVSKEYLVRRIENSSFAFSQQSAGPSGQPYVFVMEDLAAGEIVGTSAIYSKTGGYEPFYSYEIKQSIHHSEELGVHKEVDVLHLSKIHDGPSEVGSLFLSPDYWGQGHGRLLSMSRFLFIAQFPTRFDKLMIAEMRGVVGSNGRSPLWDAIGSNFFQIEFPKAETLSAESKKFIADLMPEHPIYIPLLPKNAQNVIGDVHNNTRPALALLKKEGFEFRNFIDIFDGGPTMFCETSKIRAVADSRICRVDEISSSVETSADDVPILVSNCELDFRSCLGGIRITPSPDGNHPSAQIESTMALQLNVKVGDIIRTVPLKPSSDSISKTNVRKKHVT